MSLTLVRGSWPMSQDLWSLRWEAIQEAGHKPDTDAIARLQWETSGQLIDEKFLVIMAYEDLKPVGYVSVCPGSVQGVPDGKEFLVIGWYIVPTHRRGAVATRLGLSLARVARDMGVKRLQGIVAKDEVGKMLQHHGFRAVGTVYEWEVSHGRELRPETGNQVHRETSRDSPGC